ncbi:MAG: hypothetical protein OHK0036_12330 [Bacteroidia bacterium]
MVGITNPPLEVSHNWRQTTVTMVARNFLEVNNNIFFPRVDFAGEKSGITGMEFPLLNYLIYLVSEVFGYQHWYGRLINLIITSIGIWYYYKLIRNYYNETIALYSSVLLNVSIWFQFARKIMPDTFSMTLIIISIYYGTKYLHTNRKKYDLINLFAYIVFMVLGILSKLPSGYLLIVFLFFYLDNQVPLTKKILFTSVTFLGIIPIIFWYFYWVPYLVDNFGFWHFFMGKNIFQGIHEIMQHLNLTASRFYDTALKYTGFVIFMYGLITSIINKDIKIYLLFILSFLSFSIVILKAGFNFPHHSYYIIPFVPIMALITGYGLNNIKYSKISILFLIAISIENIANQFDDFTIKKENLSIINLEEDLNKISLKNDLILINSGSCPTPMYFAHRKGWIEFNEKILDKKHISLLKDKGLKYIVILKKSFGTKVVLNEYKKILDNDNYCIYTLQ